jgi:DNA replication protein DnaC
MSECPECGGSGWITKERDGVAYAARCGCFMTAYREQLLVEAAIPPRYRHCSISNFEPFDRTQVRAQQLAFKFATEFPRGDRGLLFMGPCGVGKTHLAVSVLMLLMDRGIRCLFCDFRELLQELRDSYDPKNPTQEREIIQRASETPVLLLDDLGAEKQTEWALDRLNQILNRRYSMERATLITTNFLDRATRNDETLSERIGARLRSRLLEMCLTVEMKGKDYRAVIGQRRSALEA